MLNNLFKKLKYIIINILISNIDHKKMFREKAFDMMKKAEKAQNSWFCKDDDEIVECYEKAANMFVMSSDIDNAIKAYEKVVEYMIKNKDHYSAIMTLEKVSNIVQKHDNIKSLDLLLLALKLSEDECLANFITKIAAKLAERYDRMNKYYEAIQYYGRSYDYYEINSNNSARTSTTARNYQLKIAELNIKMGIYLDAAKIYESVSKELLDHLNKYKMLELLFKAGLCYLTYDIVATKQFIDRTKSNNFEKSSEGMFLSELLECVCCNDMESYKKLTDDSEKYDQIEKILLDNIAVNIEKNADDDDNNNVL